VWVRTVKTKSGSHAVQVVSKHKGKLTVHQHVGSYRSDREKTKLVFEANLFLRDHDHAGQQDLWQTETVNLSEIQINNSQPLFLYQLLSRIYDKLGFNCLNDEAIKDLILARVYHPVSKRETVEILSDEFGKNYSLKTIYRHLKKAMGVGLKDKLQSALITFAKKELNDSLKLVFYDVTTLAFDSQAKAGLKDFGFSKDHRFQDVQIVIGLVVNRDGFPLYFDVFNGKTFEGKTFVPVVEKIKLLLNSPDLTVIADAGMISKLNVEELNKRQIGFIVGARLANLSGNLQNEISTKISEQDQKIITIDYLGYRLICQYSHSRANKDRSTREKQLEQAKKAIDSPARISHRFRFVKTTNGKYEVNNDLLEKSKKIEGIKGYLTNTKMNELTIISRYHDLWRVEKSFRITKTDLEARPVFLKLDETISAHMVIVFASLAIARYLEIKTNTSIHQILKIARKVLTHQITHIKTGKTGVIKTTIKDKDLCGKLEKLRQLGH